MTRAGDCMGKWRMGRLLAGVTVSASLLAAQADRQGEERIENLVVVVRTADSAGAGILFGTRLGRLWLLTANHVVRRGGEAAPSINVELRWRPGERIPAQLQDTADPDLDVAVLSVAAPAPANLLHFDLLGDPGRMKRGDGVYSVGHPNGKLWEASARPDILSRSDGVHLFFQSSFVAPGHSGGALLNDRWELVGMLRSDQPPEGEAIGIDRILLWLTANRFQVDLRRTGVPGTLAEVETQIREDVVYACRSVAAFRSNATEIKGAKVVAGLSAALGKVEGSTSFEAARSQVVGALYRCLAGGYLIDEGREVADKVGIALPYLRRSLEHDPQQAFLRQNTAYLEKFLREYGGNAGYLKDHLGEYLTAVYQVLEGSNSPGIAEFVNAMVAKAVGPEAPAKSWLMKEATTPPLEEYLDGLRLLIKEKNKVDVTVEVTSQTLPNGLVEVSGKVGPNSFSWIVDHPNRRYTSNNDFTRKFMELITKPKQ